MEFLAGLVRAGSARSDARVPIWQLFTYIFLHGGIWHILFNLLYLCMFGADLERAWGSRKFYTYFFICGVGAGVDQRNREDDYGSARAG